MKSLIAILLAFALQFSSGYFQRYEPWKIISNGHSLKGWMTIGSKGRVFVQDSAIVCHMTANTLLHTFAINTTNKY